MPKGEWAVVPLAGGKTEKIMVTGDLEVLDDGNLAGVIEGYDFSMPFVAVRSENKGADIHPDFHIECRSPGGTIVRMGSIWEATSERSGKGYYSIAFYTPFGTQHRANAVQGDAEAAGGDFRIIPLTDLQGATAA